MSMPRENCSKKSLVLKKRYCQTGQFKTSCSSLIYTWSHFFIFTAKFSNHGLFDKIKNVVSQLQTSHIQSNFENCSNELKAIFYHYAYTHDIRQNYSYVYVFHYCFKNLSNVLSSEHKERVLQTDPFSNARLRNRIKYIVASWL